MLNQWIANIVGIVVIGILMDIVIPSGNTKSYIRFFIGLVTLLVILQPMLKLFKEFPYEDDSIWSGNTPFELKATSTEIGIQGSKQKEHLLKLHKIRLEEDIVIRTQEFIPDLQVSADITLADPNEEGFYPIHSIYIWLNEHNSYKIQPVEVSIRIDPEDRKDETAQNTKEEAKDIKDLKKYLSHTYEVDESRIYINIG